MIFGPIAAGAGAFFLDRYFKKKIEAAPEGSLPRDLFSGKLRLTRVHNRGFAMNRLEKNPELVRKLSLGFGLVSVVILFTAVPMDRASGRFGAALFTAGAAGNLSDRFTRGYVVDYLCIPKLTKKISFDLSDLWLVLGALLAVL